MCMPHPLQGVGQAINRMGDRQQAQQQAQAVGRQPGTGGPMPGPAVVPARTGGGMQAPMGAGGPVAPRSAPPGMGYINGPR